MDDVEEELKDWHAVGLPGEVERVRWLRHQVKVLDPNQMASPVCTQLGTEATTCYRHGLYYASAAMAAFAVEFHLRYNLYGNPEKVPWARLKSKDKRRFAFKRLVNKAKREKRIPSDLAQRLLRIQETVRHNIVHPNSMFGVRMLGLYPVVDEETDRIRYWSGRGQHMLMPKQAAEEAIQCFLLLNREYPFRIEVPKGSPQH